jgi:curli biogenesis system outer membrane secretion channel CsgG
VYGFRDQTGQYKPTPASSFSTSVTQGAASMLMDALRPAAGSWCWSVKGCRTC